MIDARQVPPDTTLQADICIVGAGPAGITLAHELKDAGLSIVLLEAGGARWRRRDEGGSRGRAADDPEPLALFRRSALGGTSTIWGGRCVPLDPIDLEVRPWLAHSGWPIAYETLAAYYGRASAYAETGEPAYDADAALGYAEDFIDGFASGVVWSRSFERFSPPTNFWERYGKALSSSRFVRVLTHGTCTGLVQEPERRTVGHAVVSTVDDRTFNVEAKTFVIAAGAIDSYRLLAISGVREAGGLGNSSGLVGRFLMSHIEGQIATLQLDPPRRKVDWGFQRSKDGVYGRRRLSVVEAEQRSRRLLNFVARLHHARPIDPSHNDAVLSTMFLAKHFLVAEYSRKITMIEHNAAAAMPTGVQFWRHHLANIVLHAPTLAVFLPVWVVRRHLARRSIPHVMVRSPNGCYYLDFNAEQAPNFDSRLVLDGREDRFGYPMPRIDWRMSQQDVDSIAANLRLVRHEIEASGVGQVYFDDADLEKAVWADATAVGGHYIGTTRMSSDATQGVVDAELRLHDVDNVFVVGSGVFPTSGHANPTLTILALALRLADRLRSERPAG